MADPGQHFPSGAIAVDGPALGIDNPDAAAHRLQDPGVEGAQFAHPVQHLRRRHLFGDDHLDRLQERHEPLAAGRGIEIQEHQIAEADILVFQGQGGHRRRGTVFGCRVGCNGERSGQRFPGTPPPLPLHFQAPIDLVPGRVLPAEGPPGRERSVRRRTQNQGGAGGADETGEILEDVLEGAVPVGRRAQLAAELVEQRQLGHVVGEFPVHQFEALLGGRQTFADLGRLHGQTLSMLPQQTTGGGGFLEQAAALGNRRQTAIGAIQNFIPALRRSGDLQGVEKAATEQAGAGGARHLIEQQDRQGVARQVAQDFQALGGGGGPGGDIQMAAMEQDDHTLGLPLGR